MHKSVVTSAGCIFHNVVASQIAAGADIDDVAVQMSNNISSAVHMAAVNIGSLTTAGTNASILGGADALTTSAMICGIDVREYLLLCQRPGRPGPIFFV